MKTKGITPSPRSGHAGILIGDKWYIAGGETRGQGGFSAHLRKYFFVVVLTYLFLFLPKNSFIVI